MTPTDEWLPPSPRLLAMRRVQVAAVTVPLAAAGGLVAGLVGSAGLGVVVAVGVLVVGLVAERFAGRRVRAWGYAERHEDLLVRRGVLIRRISVVPYGRMQLIDVTSGPFERLFGLATLRMHTAAAASDARIPGLAADTAAALRDSLAALGESRAAGV